MKIALDQQSDYSNKDLFKYLRGRELPEYVKEAEWDDHETLAELPKTAFADPDRRAFPLNTPERIFISNAYFVNRKEAIEKEFSTAYAAKIEQCIKNAAEILGVDSDIEAYNKVTTEKKAADYAERYLLEAKIGEQTANLFVVKTAADLKKAADELVRQINNIPYEWRRPMAENAVKFAQELGVDELPDIVCKYAGMFYPDLEKVRTELWRRSTKLANEKNIELYQKVAEDAVNMSSPEEVFKIAEICYYTEKEEGLSDKPKVAALLGDPVDRFFSIDIQKVASILDVIEAGGSKYHLTDLQKISADKYEEAFGFEIDPSDREKLAEILPTMPRSDVKLFEEITGLKPVA